MVILNKDLIHPQTAIKLTKNLARELAGRLRDLHKVISDLEK